MCGTISSSEYLLNSAKRWMQLSAHMKAGMTVYLGPTLWRLLLPGIQDGMMLDLLLMFLQYVFCVAYSGMGIQPGPYVDGSRIETEFVTLLTGEGKDRPHTAGKRGKLGGLLSWDRLYRKYQCLSLSQKILQLSF